MNYDSTLFTIFVRADGAKRLSFVEEAVKFEPRPCALSSPPRGLVSVYFTNTPEAHTSREGPLNFVELDFLLDSLFLQKEEEEETGQETVLLLFEGGIEL